MKSDSSLIRVLTGDRPTGPLHLGHLAGSLCKRVELHESGKHEIFVLIADGQALTDNWERPMEISHNITEVLLDYLAVGLDPEHTTIMLQTSIPELAELTTYYLNLVTLSRLRRNPTVKNEGRERRFDEEAIPMGFLCYPVSQAADITAFAANVVPVGEDQLPMLEQTREIVRTFNRLYGDGNVLVEPSPMLSKISRLPGTDGSSKMSKLMNNCIYIKDEPDVITEKVRKMYTDPDKGWIDAPGNPETNPVYQYLKAFDSDLKGLDDLLERYRCGGVPETVGKERLTEVLIEMLRPMQSRRKTYDKNPTLLKSILAEGTKKGRVVASETLDSVRSAMRLDYFVSVPS